MLLQRSAPVALTILGLAGLAHAADPPACQVTLPRAEGCLGFDLCPKAGSSATATGFELNDTYPEPYLIAPPFQTADISSCKACPVGSVASGYQFAPGHFCSQRCIALGKPTDFFSAQPLVAGAPEQGITLVFGGGDGGRKLTYNIRCKSGAPLAPAVAQPQLLHYVVDLEGDAGCGKQLAADKCPAPPPLAKPTPEQLAWSDMEIGALMYPRKTPVFGGIYIGLYTINLPRQAQDKRRKR
jgi:hypothetical protein